VGWGGAWRRAPPYNQLVRAGPRPRLRGDALHLCVLWAFAVAQPLYDLLGRNPAFFVFHRAQPVDFALFVVAVSVALPLAWAALAALSAAPLRGPWRGLPTGLAVAAAAAAFAFPLLAGPAGLPPTAALAVALLAGASLALLRARRQAVDRFLTFLAPVVLLFPLLFLVHSGIREQWLPTSSRSPSGAAEASGIPVLMVIFDALPTSSLLAEDGGIDGTRYPHFARLASLSDWYRNATTVANSTDQAVPAILSGRCPDPSGPAPLASVYPDNLFTWLGPGRRLEVTETLTALCPDALCGPEPTPWRRRTAELARDSALVYLHRLLPRAWARGIPRVDTTWGGFGDGGGSAGGLAGANQRQRSKKPGQVERFGASLERLGEARRPGEAGQRSDSHEPLLYFFHLGVPHEPYLFLPSGQRYREGEEPAGTTRVFGDDPLIPLHSLERHLLQVGFADLLLGRLLDRLEAAGRLDEALLVVTADHGTAFLPSTPRRDVVAANAPEVLAIPLFIKRPGQRAGRALDARVQTVDILATIADELRAPRPEWVDGRSALEVESRGTLSCPAGITGLPEVAPREVADAAARTQALFAVDPVFPVVATRADLLGRWVDELLCAEAGELDLRLDRPQLFAEVEPAGDFVPAEIVGTASKVVGSGEIAVAVAINGTVRATTRTYRLGGQPSPIWSATVKPSAFTAGENRVELFEIVDGPSCSLRRPAGSEAAPILDRRLGIFPVPGVETHGLLKRRESGGEFVRWTRGRVRLDVTLSPEELAEARGLRISIAEVEAGGAHFVVRVNGQRLFAARVTAGPWSRTIPLPADELESPLRIELRRLGRGVGREGELLALDGVWLTRRLPSRAPSQATSQTGAAAGRKVR
jgi:Sulfatase